MAQENEPYIGPANLGDRLLFNRRDPGSVSAKSRKQYRKRPVLRNVSLDAA